MLRGTCKPLARARAVPRHVASRGLSRFATRRDEVLQNRPRDERTPAALLDKASKSAPALMQSSLSLCPSSLACTNANLVKCNRLMRQISLSLIHRDSQSTPFARCILNASRCVTEATDPAACHTRFRGEGQLTASDSGSTNPARESE